MSKKIKRIDEKKRVRGARIVWFCGKCKRDLQGICHETKENKCPFSDKHELKYYLHVPNGNGKREARVLKGVTNLMEAQVIVMARKQELMKGRIITAPVPNIQQVVHEQESKKQETKLLIDTLAEHLNVLSDVNVPTHLKKSLSSDYLADISRGYKYLVSGLKNAGYDTNKFCITDFNDVTTGAIHDYLLNKDGLNFSNRSYSKHIQFYQTFLEYCINTYDIGRINYFKKIQKRKTIYTPEIITKENFEKLIAIIRPDNGMVETPTKEKKRRNMYKSWLAFSFKISIETGRRRSEITRMRWSDIYFENDIPIYMKVLDCKVNSIMKDDKKRVVYVPITKGLYDVIKNGFEEYVKTQNDGYIVAPEITNKREEKVGDAMSRGFSHYYKMIEPKEKKQLQYGCLRKTYLTGLEIHNRGNTDQTALVSGHGSGGKIVLSNHYLDPRAIASISVSNGFSVFPAETTKRGQELAKIRGQKETPEKGLEIQ